MIEIRPLEAADVERVDAVLPLHRLDHEGDSTYMVAWDGETPVSAVPMPCLRRSGRTKEQATNPMLDKLEEIRQEMERLRPTIEQRGF